MKTTQFISLFQTKYLQAIYSYSICFMHRACFIFFLLLSLNGAVAQSLTLNQSSSNPTPDAEEAFEFVISISCNSTTSNCQNAIVSGYLPEEVDFLNFSNPLPIGIASATYDIATRYYEITFDDGPGGALSQGSTIQFSIQAVFPGGSVEGISATNTVSATSTNATNASASTTVDLGPGGWQTSPGAFPAQKNGDREQLQGGYQYWQVEIGNIGFDDIDNYQVYDTLPSIVTIQEIRTPEIPYVDHPAQVYYQLASNPSVWVLWTNFNLNNRTSQYVSDLGLAAGDKITMVRWDFGTIPASALYNTDRYQDGFRTDIIIYGRIDTPLADGTTFTNCAFYQGNTLGNPITDRDCLTTTINSSIAVDRVRGDLDYTDLNGAYITQANIGDTIRVGINYYSEPEMTEDIYGGVMSIVLPPGIQFLPSTIVEAWNCTAFDGYAPIVESDVAIDGRQILRLIFNAANANEFVIESTNDWWGCGYYIDAVITNSTMEGTNTGYYYFNATGSTHAGCVTPDVDNFLDGYTANYCNEEDEDISIVRAPGSAGVRAEKEVIGTLDMSYSQYPSTATTVPGGLSNYKIKLTNPNATPIDSIVVIDVLPYINDTDVLSASGRLSEWRPNLAAPLTVPTGMTVFYTVSNNPCRDELAGTNPTPYPTGCTDPAWSSVPPSDITDVTALKFDIYDITLNQNDSIVLNIEMRAPVNAPTDNEVAWNSFAYIANNATTGDKLLPTEAIKVGIATTQGTVPIGGDLVWDDLNGNGLQDGGEPGIDGVRVALIEDSNGNGALNPGDQEYTWTITANGGQYIFSDFPTGDYFIQFSGFPIGYVETHQDIGSNDGLDSDGATTDLIVFNAATDRNDIDLGLYNGTLPPLWSCTSTLLSNSEFESNFTDWVDWGNTSITFDTYVNDRAMLINGGEGGRGQAISVSPGQTFTLTFFAKNTGPETAYGGINFKDVDNNTIRNQQRQVFDNSYEFHSVTATAPPNTTSIEVYGWKNAGSGAAYFDAFCLELINEVCSSGADTDGDGVLDHCDIDDDNDGIRDIDETICRGDQRQLIWWSHNVPSNTSNAEILSPSLITAGQQEIYGSGIGAYLDETLLKMAGVDQADLSSAIADNDYVEYSFTTQSNINALYLSNFAFNKHGVASLATPGNYGYDFSILVSSNGFASSQLISDVYTVDDNINPSWVTTAHEADDNYFYLRPNTTYSFRVYFYNKTTNSGIDAWFDDFEIRVESCDILLDIDGDSFANSFDLDSDNDGLTDVLESGHNGLDIDHDGILDGADTNSGQNGFFDNLETNTDNGIISYSLSDSEAGPDGIYDPYELDSDGDGCFDTEEERHYDPDEDGLVGLGIPVVGTTGLVNTHTYDDPIINTWQNPSVGICLAEDCTNGVDDDGDGLVDCDDPDCGVTTIEYYNYQKAYAVVGQDDFVTSTAGTAVNKLRSVRDVLVDPVSNKVFVADGGNDRVLRYASYDDFLNNRDAEAVLGQPNFTNFGAGTSASRMDNPNGLAIASNGDLFVSEYYNNRVLKFANGANIPSGSSADVVLGQPDFTTSTNGRTQTKMFRPYEMIIENDNTLWVADGWNGRVLRFDNATTLGNGAPANGVLGQTNYTSHITTVDAIHIDQTTGLAMVNGILFVGDYQANRVLIWENAKNAPNGAPANRVLGQPDFTTDTSPIDARHVGGISDLDIDPSNNLFVQDIWQDRTTIFYDAPNVTNYQAANVILHQPDFTTILGGVNVTQRKSYNPNGIRYSRQGYVNYLLEGEQGGHRVLITRPAIETDEITAITDTLPGRDLSGQNSANFAIVSQPTDGSVTINDPATGEFTYTPPGMCPIDVDTSFTFLYSITNIYGCIDTAEMLVFVNDVDACKEISGLVFEDINYGGGSGRNFTVADLSATSSGWSSGAIGVQNAIVELYDNSDAFIKNTITDANGFYLFDDLVPGNYQVRIVNSSISSNRGSNGTGQPIIPVQIYRHDGVTEYLNQVGGADRNKEDGPQNTTDANLSTFISSSTAIQSLSQVDVSFGDISNVDFGFNFDVIVNLNNSGQGSLRQFILNSNELDNTNLDQEDFPITGENLAKAPEQETSIFMLPGLGIHTINVTTVLPAITDNNTHISGYTQEGSTQGNISTRTNTIVLDGKANSFDGLILGANDVHISGLVINDFRSGITTTSSGQNLFVWGNFIGTGADGITAQGNSSIGINIQNYNSSVLGTNGDGINDINEGNLVSDNNYGIQIRNTNDVLIAGNIVGLDKNGTSALGNTFNGIYIRNATGKNVIGYDDQGVSSIIDHYRNISSANGNDGIRILESSDQVVAGNYLGTDITGTLPFGNTNYGIQIQGASSNNFIGTDADGSFDSLERNVISGNGSGIRLLVGGTGINNRISGNYVGVTSSGNSPLGNLNSGLDINGDYIQTVIGTNGDNINDVIERNIISGNGADGIRFANSDQNTIAGNFIGLGADGITAIPNDSRGIFFTLTSSENVVGYASTMSNTNPLEVGNRVAYNGDTGIAHSGTGTQNRFSRNQVFNNGSLGIDLSYDGVTTNDNGDGDLGANTLINFPVITSAFLNGNILTVQGFATATSEIEFYEADLGPSPNPLPALYTDSFGEGSRYLFSRDEGSLDDTQPLIGTYNNDGTGIITNRTQSRFSFRIDVSSLGLTSGQRISAILIDGNGNTSEFSGVFEIVDNCGTAIMNPHIMYYPTTNK